MSLMIIKKATGIDHRITQELLIFGRWSVLADAQEIHATFYDGTSMRHLEET